MLCLQASNKALGKFKNLWWTLSRQPKVSQIDTKINSTDFIFINFCRLVHAFTTAGIIPSQYTHFSMFAELGVVGKWYINNGMLCIHIRHCL